MVKLKRVLTARGSQKSGEQWYDFRDDKGEFYQELQKSAKEEQVEKAIKMPEIKK